MNSGFKFRDDVEKRVENGLRKNLTF